MKLWPFSKSERSAERSSTEQPHVQAGPALANLFRGKRTAAVAEAEALSLQQTTEMSEPEFDLMPEVADSSPYPDEPTLSAESDLRQYEMPQGVSLSEAETDAVLAELYPTNQPAPEKTDLNQFMAQNSLNFVTRQTEEMTAPAPEATPEATLAYTPTDTYDEPAYVAEDPFFPAELLAYTPSEEEPPAYNTSAVAPTYEVPAAQANPEPTAATAYDLAPSAMADPVEAYAPESYAPEAYAPPVETPAPETVYPVEAETYSPPVNETYGPPAAYATPESTLAPPVMGDFSSPAYDEPTHPMPSSDFMTGFEMANTELTDWYPATPEASMAPTPEYAADYSDVADPAYDLAPPAPAYAEADYAQYDPYPEAESLPNPASNEPAYGLSVEPPPSEWDDFNLAPPAMAVAPQAPTAYEPAYAEPGLQQTDVPSASYDDAPYAAEPVEYAGCEEEPEAILEAIQADYDELPEQSYQDEWPAFDLGTPAAETYPAASNPEPAEAFQPTPLVLSDYMPVFDALSSSSAPNQPSSYAPGELPPSYDAFALSQDPAYEPVEASFALPVEPEAAMTYLEPTPEYAYDAPEASAYGEYEDGPSVAYVTSASPACVESEPEVAYSAPEEPVAYFEPADDYPAEPEYAEYDEPLAYVPAPEAEVAVARPAAPPPQKPRPVDNYFSITDSLDNFEAQTLLRESHFMKQSIDRLVDAYFGQQQEEAS